MSQGDKFYALFLGDQCLGKQCYEHCKFKYDQSSADIRIGDLWGAAYKNDEKGVSAAVSFTEKGDRLLHELDCNLVEQPFEVVAEGQMRTMPKRSALYSKILECLHCEESTIDDVYHLQVAFNKRKRNLGRIRHPLRSMANIIKRLGKKL